MANEGAAQKRGAGAGRGGLRGRGGQASTKTNTGRAQRITNNTINNHLLNVGQSMQGVTNRN